MAEGHGVLLLPASVSLACLQSYIVSSLGPFSQEQTSAAESIPLPRCLWRGEAPGKILNVPLVCPHTWHKAAPCADRAGAGKVGREARGQEPRAHSPYTEFLKEILEIQEWYIHPSHQEGALVKVGRLKTFHHSLAFFVTLPM